MKETLGRLRQAVQRSVASISLAVAARDPYTAVHQTRVAELAVAIAEALELDPEKVEVVKMAGAVHDVGKLRVPVDILSKPGRLTEAELMLVRTHPEAGYEIVRPLDLPWPVGEIILQHHERMNGSGYPRGLAGDAILLEARILAVADVAEAMLSHRPYRPAHTLEETVEELLQNRGTLYDPEVVAACVRVLETSSELFPPPGRAGADQVRR